MELKSGRELDAELKYFSKRLCEIPDTSEVKVIGNEIRLSTMDSREQLTTSTETSQTEEKQKKQKQKKIYELASQIKVIADSLNHFTTTTTATSILLQDKKDDYHSTKEAAAAAVTDKIDDRQLVHQSSLRSGDSCSPQRISPGCSPSP